MTYDCFDCPITSKEQQDAVIDATIKAAYLDPNAATSLRAIATMLPRWIKADHKRVGRRLNLLRATGALPQLDRAAGKDGKHRPIGRAPKAVVPGDFSPRIAIHGGDAREELRHLPDDSIDCCVTSPPYYQQMDVHIEEQIGQEPTVEQYIQNLVSIFDEVRRVLKRTGTCWINIADTFRDGQSLLVPQRLALALTKRGWKLRAEIIVEKANPAPYRHEGRPTPSHETLLFFCLNVPHYFDREHFRRQDQEPQKQTAAPQPVRGTVWRIPPVRHSAGGHPAPMRIPLAKDCVLIGCPPGGTVLDPFCGIGTTLVAAAENYRHAIGIELSPYYLTLARKRLADFATV